MSKPPQDGDPTNSSFRQLPGPALTPREQEVASLVIAGLTNREIGERLYISPLRARNIVSDLYIKLDVRNRVELVGKLYGRL